MSLMPDLGAFGTALAGIAPLTPAPLSAPLGRAVLVGSGDSLASALVAARFGHRALSSGDLTWTGSVPPGCDTVVGVSHSGTSGATVRALRLARGAGLHTVAVTSRPDSPLAEAAADVQPVPALPVTETVPCAGHVMLALGVAAVCGLDVKPAPERLAAALPRIRALAEQAVAELPEEAPHAISILSLPELRSAADFWSLKLIEATGIAARVVPLEESGHVDYFIGPQRHLTLALAGTAGLTRFDRLAEALVGTGQVVRRITVRDIVDGDDAEVLTDVAAAIAGAAVAHAAATRWERRPFRGGAVNMDARHIKLDD
ncbi:hypothetical protein [Prauserella flavalba]|uniref:SIS domain-containing protein n=1 Tax=Prauserella flavalba TaxID=1477506 RepID=A0A318LPT7_9PSEU|nr:hypothetical protein [Prauserella flavalba]PXY35364.1 hypothetical protein BA062_07400 [Prauserella flavalba]